MANRRLHSEQPASFAFSGDNQTWAEAQITKFPEGRQASAVIPLLWRAQEQEGWVSEPALRAIADMLDMPYIRVLEVATFYTMFQLQPVGKKAHIQVCGTTPCRLRGAEDIIKVCKKRIAEHPHALSADGDFSWEEVECLGACVNAPMIEVFSDTYEDLTEETFGALLDGFASGNPPKPGPQNGRQFAVPEGGSTTLLDPELYDGSRADAVPSGLAAALEALKAKGGEAAIEEAAPVVEAAKKEAETVEATPSDDDKPAGLEVPAGGVADDLKKISGVGPKIEGILNDIGIFHFQQISDWNEANKAWVDNYLSFKGRIDREDWVGQAKVLAEGLETDFSKRVDEGDVPSSQDDGEA